MSSEPASVAPDASAISSAVARNLRSLRHERGWTLDTLAARSGVSKGMIVQVEQARTNPSIQTMWRLASALGVGLAGLLAIDAEPPLRIVAGDEVIRLWDGANGGTGDYLAGSEEPSKTELWDWTIQPGESYDGQVHPRATREMLYVLDGEVDVILDGDQRAAVRATAAAVYRADRPHRLENRSDRPSRVIMIVIEGAAS